MINSRAMPALLPQTHGRSRPSPLAQRSTARLCRGPGTDLHARAPSRAV